MKTKFTKSILLSLFIVFSIFTISGCSDDRPTINIYNWGDYIDPEVLDIFEEEYNVKVVYDTFATNEDLYVKIKQGGSSYDVIFPSDYMIERMIKENLIQKIDINKIQNIENVDERFMNLDYDPDNQYSVPYMWGTVGIIYNKNLVNRPLTKWADLWDEEFKGEIIMLNSQRDTLAVALKKLHYSMNTRNIDELEEAKNELIKQRPLVYAYQGDEIKDSIISEEAAIGVVWSGDAVAMMRENPNLVYVLPEEGTNLWFDAMVIPKDAKNVELAHEFINFMLRPDIAAKNAEYIGYSSPLPKAIELLSDELKNNKVAYPDFSELENTEIFKDPSDMLQEYDRIWTEIFSSM
ncbi:spermidine/putrescine ABC transporter substrate-binding protein [Soehngenia saccharolytica]|nr:spermidine/putrescine ABC transporter substrate-binding protein [Soehngenia saccharolytica]